MCNGLESYKWRNKIFKKAGNKQKWSTVITERLICPLKITDDSNVDLIKKYYGFFLTILVLYQERIPHTPHQKELSSYEIITHCGNGKICDGS